MNVRVPIDLVAISDLCRRWRVMELSLFGSVLRDDFRPDSDIDVLVTFAADAPWSLLDLVTLREHLRQILGREVHLVEQEALRNPFRRQAPTFHRGLVSPAWQWLERIPGASAVSGDRDAGSAPGLLGWCRLVAIAETKCPRMGLRGSDGHGTATGASDVQGTAARGGVSRRRIVIPEFQREYVWRRSKAPLLIDSL
jgi:predicted nucleotidyltransferase